MTKNTTGAPRVIVFLTLAAAASGCGSEQSDTPDAVGSAAQAVWGGQNDQDTVEANAVVDVFWVGQCSGTLITPTVVLTANHCISGKTSGQIRLGATQSDISAASNVVTASRATAVSTAGFGNAMKGLDVGLIFLDQPVVSQAKIVRPSLNPPTWPGDVNGGAYPGLIGFAGWSPFAQDGQTSVFVNRQAVIFSGIQLEHEPVSQGALVGQEWIKSESVAGIGRGDSGGPLFVLRSAAGCAQRADCNTRDVLGVASYDFQGVLGSEAHWTDVTRGFPRQWILDQIVDHTHDNQPAWLARHPATAPGTVTAGDGSLVEKWQETSGPRWLGEVDYTGTCQTQFDRDCDHWYDEHDNCPSVSNPDQADTLGNGVGDACPPAASAPTSCTFWTTCGGSTSVHCDDENAVTMSLERATPAGDWVTVATTTQTDQQPAVYLSDSSLRPTQAGLWPSATYRVCAFNRLQQGACIDPGVSVTLDWDSCGTDGGGGGGSSGGGGNGKPCGGKVCLE